MIVDRSLFRSWSDAGELLTSGDLELDNVAHQYDFGNDESLIEQKKQRTIRDVEYLQMWKAYEAFSIANCLEKEQESECLF
ncbi:MAG TPA: hypothetical protein V6D15_16045 [Oculatellaceae cyanobacterium]|jgi:hypothetical protein